MLLPKQQLRLKNFCTEYDIPRTTVLELKYSKDFPLYKIGNRWYVDVQKFIKWREIYNY